MSEPWSGSHFPPYRRSKTVLGEIGDATKRKNSYEVNRLGARLRLMGREMQVVNNEIRHQQSVLEVKVSNSLSARRLSASAANTRDLLIRHEQNNMQTINQKCKDFLHSGMAGTEAISRTSIECTNLDEGEAPANSPSHQTNSPHSSSDNSLAACSAGSCTDQEKSSSSGTGVDSGSSSDADTTGKRERRVGVVHNMDVHLELESSESDSIGYFPGRKEQRTRRGSNNNNKWEFLSQPKYPVRSKRELEVKHQEEMKKLATEVDGTEGARGRRRSLPVILGRSMTRHDRRNSKSRDNLLLPEVGRNRSVSPDVRFRVKYDDDDDGTISPIISDVPFSQRNSPRQLQPLRSQQVDGHSGSVSPRPAVARLEIDLSLPVASMAASPRPSPKVQKPDKNKLYSA